MLLNNVKTIIDKYDGIMDSLSHKKEIFGDLRDDYIAMYKMLTDHEGLAKDDYKMQVYHIGDFDGVCHLLISVDADFIQHEIVRGTYSISSPNRDNTDVEIEMLMMTTSLQRHDEFLQIALETYFLDGITNSEVMTDLSIRKLPTAMIPRWKKLIVVTDVAFAIALSHDLPDTTPLEAEYGNLTPLIKDIIQVGPSPYTLNMADLIEREDLDKAYDAAIHINRADKVLKLESNSRQTDN